MKKIIKVVGIIILLIIAFVFIAGIFLPKSLHIEREVTINASHEKVWSNVNSLHGLHTWSPWIEADPNIKITYEGQDGTVGAVYKWVGNSDVGEGVQTISKVEQPNTLGTHIHFIEPFDGEADADIKVSDVNNATKVLWTMDSKYPYPKNIMLLMNMDKMIGDKYVSGLNKLKTICESN